MNLFLGLLNLGISDELTPYERRRAKVFNSCNLAGLVITLLRLSYLWLGSAKPYPGMVLAINGLPLLICGFMATCMIWRYYQTAIAVSFIFFPPVLVVMAFFSGDGALEIFLFLYMLFIFFFLHRRWQILSAFVWIVGCFLVMHFWLPVLRSPDMPPVEAGLSVIDYSFGLLFIFIALYFIKFEVWKFEKSIRDKKEELKRLNAVKDKVFSVISHDLRSPIASIILLLREMNNAGLTYEEFSEFLPNLLGNMEQTSELLDNLLAWARSQIKETALNANSISIARLTQQTLKFLDRTASSKNVLLVNEVPADCCAFADESSISIVLRNLVGNAIKFTPSGGTVTVTCHAAGEYVKVIVEDTGVGIPPNKQPLLFGEGYYTSLGTNKEAGSGLGLLICRDLVEQNGGSLLFASEQGIGTTFSFSLPNHN